MAEELYDPDSFPTDDDSEGPVPTDEELAEFRQQVGEWIKIDEQVKKLSIAMRERRIHQKALGARIQEFMMRYKYDHLNHNSGCRIRSNVRQVKQPIKLTEIREKILEFQGLSGEDLIKSIFDADRPLVERRSLRRIVPKVSMSLDI